MDFKLEKKRVRGRKALSPVITTVLLILLAIILAVIIFLWARGFISEHITKFDPSTSEEKPIDDACQNVKFEASIVDENIFISNTGDISIHKMQLRISGSGGKAKTETVSINLIQAASAKITPTNSISGSSVELTPILLGKKQGSNKQTEYACRDKIQKIE